MAVVLAPGRARPDSVMLAGVEIGAATGGDGQAALQVWRAVEAAAGTRPSTARTSQVAARLAGPEALLLVAREAGEVVAMALGEPGRPGDGEGDLLNLALLVVHPSARRRGVGSALAEALADAGYLRGARRLTAWTRVDDAAGTAFYAALGLQPTGREQVRDGPGVQYVAELDPPLRDLVVRQGGLRLGQLLKLAGLAETGAEAKALLADGQVEVNGEVELRRGRQLVAGDVVGARDAAVRVVLGTA